jgi:hypothetical protein
LPSIVARRFKRSRSALAFLAAVVALVSQIALGGTVPAQEVSDEQIAALNAIGISCDSSQPPGQGDASHHDHRPAPAICPISVALALPSVVLTPAPILPPPSAPIAYARAMERPPGRGPPPATSRVGVPRAPPAVSI